MKTSALVATVFASLAAAASPYWYITELQTLDTTSTTLESSLRFTFEDASTSLTTTCSYVNSPGSGRPATVLTATPCENPQVQFTYIQTSAKTGQIAITLQHLNAAYVKVASPSIMRIYRANNECEQKWQPPRRTARNWNCRPRLPNRRGPKRNKLLRPEHRNYSWP